MEKTFRIKSCTLLKSGTGARGPWNLYKIEAEEVGNLGYQIYTSFDVFNNGETVTCKVTGGRDAQSDNQLKRLDKPVQPYVQPAVAQANASQARNEMSKDTTERITLLSAISSAATFLAGAPGATQEDVVKVARYFARKAFEGLNSLPTFNDDVEKKEVGNDLPF